MVDFTPDALRVLGARYFRRDAARRVIEKSVELIQRVARAVAQAEFLFSTAAAEERCQETFQGLLGSLDFPPNSPTLMNAGTPLGQLSACFVVPRGFDGRHLRRAPRDGHRPGSGRRQRLLPLGPAPKGRRGRLDRGRGLRALPEDAFSDAVAGAYLEGWRLGLKGVSLYRSGSRDAQVLCTGEEPATLEHFARCDVGACRL